MTSLTDSRELEHLRVRFRDAHPGVVASAERLGRFACRKAELITDFGRHSLRWRQRFHGGWQREQQRLTGPDRHEYE